MNTEMHRTNNMVLVQIFGRLFVLIIVVSNAIQGYEYPEDMITQETKLVFYKFYGFVAKNKFIL